MSSYEIEIKSLLGNKENADKLREGIAKIDPESRLIAKSKQLNHYFIGGDLEKLYESVSSFFSKGQTEKLRKMIEEGKNFSVRTRKLDNKILLVIKASIDDTTSSNGISRIEFEEEVPGISLDDLDNLLLGAGFSYQAKWSREREEYRCMDVNVSIDKNAGYGYLAEFERIIDDRSRANEVKESLRALMGKLNVVELTQDRLERMFAHYNENWQEYYGTDKIFVIE